MPRTVFYALGGGPGVTAHMVGGRRWPRTARIGLPAHTLGARVEYVSPTAPGYGLPARRPRAGTALVFQAPGQSFNHPDGDGLVTTWAHEHELRVFFDVDNWGYLPTAANVGTAALTAYFNHLVGFRALVDPGAWWRVLDLCWHGQHAAADDLRTADGLLCASETIAHHYRRLNPKVTVCRTGVDRSSWPAPPHRRGPFRIGIAGTPGHLRDYDSLLPALRWAAEQPDVEIVVLGMNPADARYFDPGELPRSTLTELGEGRRRPSGVIEELVEVRRQRARDWDFPYRHLPWVETFSAYRRNMQTLDVALCPLRRGWSALRADSKPLEHLAAGTLPIVSDIETYEYWRGLAPMARTQRDWLARVRWAVENRDEVREMTTQLRERVMEERSIEREIAAWRVALGSAPD